MEASYIRYMRDKILKKLQNCMYCVENLDYKYFYTCGGTGKIWVVSDKEILQRWIYKNSIRDTRSGFKIHCIKYNPKIHYLDNSEW